MCCISTGGDLRVVVVRPQNVLVVNGAAVNIDEGIREVLLAVFASALAYLVPGGGSVAVNVAVLAAAAGMSGVAFLGTGRRCHDGVVSVLSEIAVGLTAFVAYRLVFAVGNAAAVGGLAAELIPAFVYGDAVLLELGSKILQRLAAALAAQPVIGIVIAVVDILDTQIGKQAFIGNVLQGGEIAVLYHVDKIVLGDIETRHKARKIYRRNGILARMQVVTRAGVDYSGIVGGLCAVGLEVHIAANGAYVVSLHAVLCAGLFDRRNKFERRRAAVRAGSIISSALLNYLSAAEALGIAGVAGLIAHGLDCSDYLRSAGVIIRVALAVVIAAGHTGAARAAGGLGITENGVSAVGIGVSVAAMLAHSPVSDLVVCPFLNLYVR